MNKYYIKILLLIFIFSLFIILFKKKKKKENQKALIKSPLKQVVCMVVLLIKSVLISNLTRNS